MGSLRIGPALFGACDERRVEIASLGPQLRARRTDAVSAFGDRLVPGGDLCVPAIAQPVPLEPCHELVERRGAPLHSMRGKRLTENAPRLLSFLEQPEHEELQ